MEVLILLVFVSAVLVVGAVVFFVWSVREGTHEHADRLALLPLDGDGEADGTSPARPAGRDRQDSADEPVNPSL